MKPMLFRPRVSPLALLGGALMNDFDSTMKRMGEIIDRPSANIVENDDNYVLELVVPGFTRDHINLEVIDGNLVISGEVTNDNQTEDNDTNYRLREFSTTKFKRSFNLYDKINTENISAHLQDGVLKVTLNKKEEVKPETKKIEIS